MTRLVCFIDKNGQYGTCIRDDDVPCEQCEYNERVVKVYQKTVMSCWDCPNYSCISPEIGICRGKKEWIDGVIKVYKRIEDPSMIQSWCPLPDEESN